MVEKEGKDRFVLSRGPWADSGRMMDQASTFWFLEVVSTNEQINMRTRMSDSIDQSLYK